MTVSSLNVMPEGLLYIGTQISPFTSGSITSRSTASISGPSGPSCTGIISMPRVSHIWKCQSYPGTGHMNLTRGSFDHGVSTSMGPHSSARVSASWIMFILELPPTII